MCVDVGEVCSEEKKVDMWHAPKGRATFFRNAFGKLILKVIKKKKKQETSHSGYILEGVLESRQSYFF